MHRSTQRIAVGDASRSVCQDQEIDRQRLLRGRWVVFVPHLGAERSQKLTLSFGFYFVGLHGIGRLFASRRRFDEAAHGRFRCGLLLELHDECRLGLVELLAEFEFQPGVACRRKFKVGMRRTACGAGDVRPANGSLDHEVPDRIEVGHERQRERVLAPLVLDDRQGEVEQDSLRIAGEDREDPHFEQVVADHFEYGRVAPPADDRLIDVRRACPVDEFSFDQLDRRSVHRKAADRRPFGQVEDERPFLLYGKRIVKRLVDLHECYRRVQHDVDVVSRQVQPHGRARLRIGNDKLSQPLRPRRGPRRRQEAIANETERNDHRECASHGNVSWRGRVTRTRLIYSSCATRKRKTHGGINEF